MKEHIAGMRENRTGVRDILAHGVPYTLAVHARSNLRLTAHLVQKSHEPGAEAYLVAQLTEFDLPLRGPAEAEAEITDPAGRPDGARLGQTGDGRFDVAYPLNTPGAYRFRLRARGLTHDGQPFTREQTFTASVWRGGDKPPPSGDASLPVPDGEKGEDGPGGGGRPGRRD